MSWHPIRQDTAATQTEGAELAVNLDYGTEGELRVRPGYESGALTWSAGPLRALVSYNPTEGTQYLVGIGAGGAEALDGDGLVGGAVVPRVPPMWAPPGNPRRGWDDAAEWNDVGWPPARPPPHRDPQPGDYTVTVALDVSQVSSSNNGTLTVVTELDGANTDKLLGQQIVYRVLIGEVQEAGGNTAVVPLGGALYGAEVDLSYTIDSGDIGETLTVQAYVAGFTDVAETTAEITAPQAVSGMDDFPDSPSTEALIKTGDLLVSNYSGVTFTTTIIDLYLATGETHQVGDINRFEYSVTFSAADVADYEAAAGGTAYFFVEIRSGVTTEGGSTEIWSRSTPVAITAGVEISGVLEPETGWDSTGGSGPEDDEYLVAVYIGDNAFGGAILQDDPLNVSVTDGATLSYTWTRVS